MTHNFPPAFLDEVRARTPLPKLIGRKVKLTRAGDDLKGCCPFHDDRTPSFTVYDDGYHCYGCGAHGDAISFVMQSQDLEFKPAVIQLAADAGLPLPDHINGTPHHINGKSRSDPPKAAPDDDWVPMVPPPADAPEPSKADLRCDVLHTYRDAGGRVLFYVRRIEARNGKPKTFLPLTYGALKGRLGWHGKAADAPRRLYGLDRLARRPEAPVIVCEGEKAADAAGRLFPDHVCVTWPGGAKAVDKADWQPLIGRKAEIVIWPDNDAPGHEAAAKVKALVPGARVLRVDDLPEGHDAADVQPDDPEAWLRERLPEPTRGAPHGRIWEKAEPEAEPDAPKRKRTVNALALVNFMGAQPEWRQALRVNLLTETLEVSEQFPPDGASSATFRPLREPADLLEAMLWFQGNGFAKAGKTMVWDALAATAYRNAYHPVRDYLDGLAWDGTARLGRLFQHYFNADTHGGEDRTVAYLEHVGACFMVSAVARIRQPGCKVDTLPVLVGKQGYGKSRAIRAFCPDPGWFSDDLSADLAERDTKESLVGKWLIELAELPHVRKEVERVKAFISRQTDRYRRAYDRSSSDWPRQCVFIGSTNDLELIDVTGNRRFWPVEVTAPIDVARIEQDRDQLWAEAVHLHQTGFEWWLRPNLEAIAAEQQAQFAEEDVWTPLLGAWAEQQSEPFTLLDTMKAGLRFTDEKLITKADQMRAGACLKSLGYRRRRVRDGANRPWLWQREKVGPEVGTGGNKVGPSN